jgi:serine/threonine-protein kinase
MAQEDRSPTGSCPEREALVAFQKGEMPVPELEAIAAHLETCVECEKALRALEEAPTVARLGLALRADLLPAESECQAMEDRAKALIVDGGNFTVSVGSAQPTVEWHGPRSFANFDLLEKIGQGGMGVVFKAWQRTLRRFVAVKMLLPARQTDAEAMTRMRIDAEALARLRHPNVVLVHEFGEHDGQLYLVMEYLDGGNLASRFANGPLPEDEAASLVATLASAVQAAHEADIVHRDLKPGNVLLASDGTRKITDFGLARLVDDPEGANTRSEAILGTTQYMAPEQAAGKIDEVGRAADIYALGVILYEALTGRPPFKGTTPLHTLELIQRTEVVWPGRLRKGLSRDLEAVCLKCLEKDPRRRYATAQELAADLQAQMQGSPTAARPLTLLARFGRWLSRHPAWVAAALLLLCMGALVPAVQEQLDPDRPRREIEAALARGEPVVLIGPTGGPRWSRWEVGGERHSFSARPDGPFLVSAWAYGYLELIRDPQMDRYRFRARVKHDRGELVPRVGVYFGHRFYPTSAATVMRFFGQLTFDDITDPQMPHNLAKGEGRISMDAPPPPKVTQASLTALALPEYPNRPGRWIGTGIGVSSGEFVPAGPSGGPWHDVAVEVTPTEVRGTWDGQKMGAIPASRFVQTTLESLRWPPVLAGLGFDPNQLQLQYAPRGSLGLFVDHSSASFANVVIEPLAGPD